MVAAGVDEEQQQPDWRCPQSAQHVGSDRRINQTGTIVATTDGWDAALAPTFAAVRAFAWTEGSKDAAMLVTLAPGAYTAQVKGKDGGT